MELSPPKRIQESVGGFFNPSSLTPGKKEEQVMRGRIRNAFGILLIITGLIAMPVPIIPGFPLVIAGAAILGRRHPLIRPWWAWLQKRGYVKEEESTKS
jgi:hypothetical protein